MTGFWRPLDLMSVRDAAVTDIVPKMSKLDEYGGFSSPRMIYNLGHAVFEFMEAKWGKEGLRQYLFALRKSVIGGGENAYEEAFKIKAEDFDQQFEKYLKDRFKPFRDKERPSDYGRNLAPEPGEDARSATRCSAEPSPSGDLIAVVTGNRKDQEADIVLVSGKDGSVIRNLTKGFDQDQRLRVPDHAGRTLEHRALDVVGARRATSSPTSSAPRSRARLILQNVVTRKIEDKFDMRDARRTRSRPTSRPTASAWCSRRSKGGVGDIFMLDLQTRMITNLTKDAFGDSGPTWSPDGKFIVYVARVSGNEKLFRLDIDTGKKTQITFGTHDDSAAQFLDQDTLVFPSTATDPSQPIDPDVARNGDIYNIWTLNLKNGELRQYTDAMSGNSSPIVLHRGNEPPQMAFISYYKGDYELHALDRRDPIITAASSDFGAPGPVIDFQAPLSHTLITDKIQKKGKFEKMFLDGRPPVNVGVTSGGDVFGGTAVTFSDVLGDQQFNLYAASISQYRTLSFSYTNLSRRLQLRAPGLLADPVLLRAAVGASSTTRPTPAIIDRDLATATTHHARRHRLRHLPVQPLPPRRVLRRLHPVRAERSTTRRCRNYSQDYQQEQFGRSCFSTATSCRSACLRAGDDDLPRVRAALGQHHAPALRGRAEDRQLARRGRPPTSTRGTTSASADRACWRCARRGSTAGAARRTSSTSAATPRCAATTTCSSSAAAASSNAELRFPLIEAMLTPLGVLGGIRGVFFANMGGAYFDGAAASSGGRPGTRPYMPIIGYNVSPIVSADAGSRFTAAPDRRAACASSTPAPPTASVSRPSRSASPSTSTGRGRRS